MRARWPFRLVAILVGLALCYFAATMALAATQRRSAPAWALKLAPYDAQALANTAFAELTVDRSPPTLARAEAMSKRALTREPVNVAALRTLGLVATMRGDIPAAKARFTLVERLSRRDLATQLWWIEYEVARNSVTGALTYFDEALRTSPQSANLLMPVLVKAAQEAPIASALRTLLAPRPSYFRPFFIQASDTTPNIREVARLGMTLLDRRNPDDQDLINRLILRFGRDGKYDDARRVFAWADGTEPNGNVTNGDLDHPAAFSLFNWDLTDRNGLSAEISPRDGSNSLYLVARVSRGLVARQLLRLSAGRYELSAVVGDTPDAVIDRPTIDVTCAGSNRSVLAPVQFPSSPSPATPLRAVFGIGPDCAYQWLNLQAAASSEDETRAWIDDIRIAPAGSDQH